MPKGPQVVVEGEALEHESGHQGLEKGTNWWGAFVIGLAGTILITGSGPVFLTTFGASYVPIIIFFTATGWALCMLLAELSAMMPNRTGGSPTYAYLAYRDRWPRLAKHINGVCCWMYWIGWMPVAPLNMILASFYLGDLLGLNMKAGFTPVSTFISWWTIIIAVIGLFLIAIPAYKGIRFGTGIATVLAVLAMIPLTFLTVGWIIHPAVANWGELAGFRQLDGSGFFSSVLGHPWWMAYLAYAFPLTWTVIAMEAAACYIGETRNPDRDAKIAMTLEGGYGMFVYGLLPISFIVVLGASQLSDPALVDPKTMFVHFAEAIFGSGGQIIDWLVAFMLIIALALSALNSIMGCSRALHQLSVDGEFPRFFQHINKHGVPDRAMATNIAANLVVVFMGGAIEIYAFSNVGYLGSFVPVLVGYYLLRKYKPNARRPFKLPEYWKYVSLFIALLYFVVWLCGGIIYAVIGGQSIYYFIGWFGSACYLPLAWWRKRQDQRHPETAPPVPEEPGEEVGAVDGVQLADGR